MVDASIDIFEEIEKLKKSLNAIVLAHYYQEPDIQDIADYVGDSLGLSQQAKNTNADIIVFVGVHFMAETAKIINPKKKVLLPDLKAGCSLAESAPYQLFKKFKEKYPDHIVVSYINCTAEIKTLSDIICTSSNAEKIIHSIPKNQKIIFAPDKNLGQYLIKKTGKDMVLWQGSCIVHETFSLEQMVKLKIRYPDAKILAHPECEENLLEKADYIGSTTALLQFSKKDSAKQYIVATESGILHPMMKVSPNKMFIPAPTQNKCACNMCPYMRLNTLEKIYDCMLHQSPEILLSDDITQRAKKPIERMLELSASSNK